MKRIAIVALLLTGCATQQSVTLLPREGSMQRGIGSFDHIHQLVTVDVGGRRYQGRPTQVEARTSAGLFGPSSYTTTNQASALLIGEGGQLRCSWTWGPMKVDAQGECIDSRGAAYDLLIKN